jgi:hypothetical protein
MLIRSAVFALAALAVGAAVPMPAAAAPCLTIANQTYCQVWSNRDSSMSKTEFLRKGETVDNWKNMVTILRYNDVRSLKAALNLYMGIVSAYMGPDDKPVWIVPDSPKHTQEVATRLALATKDLSDQEFVTAYFYRDAGKPAYGIILSQHPPLPDGATDKAHYAARMADLRAIDAGALTH